MKKILTALVFSAAMASPAIAVSIPTIGASTAGAVDDVVAVTTGIQSSPSAETAWVSTIFSGYSVTSNINGANVLYTVTGAPTGTYAIDLTGFGSPACVSARKQPEAALIFTGQHARLIEQAHPWQHRWASSFWTPRTESSDLHTTGCRSYTD